MTRELLDVPDQPRWVEARAILDHGDGWITAAGAGHVVGHDASGLLIATADADADAVVRIADPRAGYSLLVPPERADLRAALEAAGWSVEEAQLYGLPDADALPDDDGALRVPAGERPSRLALDQLPAPLARELETALGRGDLWCAVVEGAPVAFASAPWRSDRWFDVSVETLPPYRQLGLATRVAAALIRAERAGGREPVWAAVESNGASHRLAVRLGFAPVDTLWVAARAG